MPPDAGDADLLHAVGARYQEHLEERHIYFATLAGRTVEHLPEVTAASYREEEETHRRLLERLDDVRPEGLGPADKATLASLRWDLEMGAERARFFVDYCFHAMPRSIRNHGLRDLFTGFRFASAADGERYLRLLDQVPAFVDGVRESHRRQAAKGIFMPPAAVDQTLPLWRSFHGQGGDSLFHVGAGRVADLEGGEALRAEVARRVETSIRPAIRRLVDYLDGDYRRAAPDTVGFAHVPGGDRFYRHSVRWATTLDLGPEELHRMGQEQLRQLEERMAEIRRSLGFSGTREAFHPELKEDDRFYAKTPEEVGERLRSWLARIEPHIDAFFLRRPKAPYTVRRLPKELEGALTWGYYEPPTATQPHGIYFFNGSALRERTLIHAGHLIFHELVPGHHFQVALQAANENLPSYRRGRYYIAHAEGWAVYASYLAEEMGLYDDPYSLYGALAGRMLYAARLVVDTGLNHFGWSREQAAEILRSYTLTSDTQIQTEILRYGVDLPGQALAYSVGAAKFLEWRRRAEDALGDAFDVRRFHTALLDQGAMPLQVLDAQVDAFIAEERRRARKTVEVSPGESVRILRELQELSQNDLSRLTGIPQSTISAIENERIKLGVERAKVLARALRCHPAVLVFPGWEIERESAA